MNIDQTQSSLSNLQPSAVAPRQLLQIHDSILVECMEADAENVATLMKETMENIAPNLGIRLAVDVHTGKNWGEL